MAKKNKGISFLRKVLISAVILIALIGGYGAYRVYQKVYQPNIIIKGADTTYFYIPTGSDLQDVINSLYEKGFVKDRNTLEWIAEKKNYKNHVHPGRYLLEDGMNNNALIDLLRSGNQSPVNVIFNNVRTKEDLAGQVAKRIEADSTELIRLLKSYPFAQKYGFTEFTVMTMFLPNTYELYWNTSAEEFFQRMAKEYKAFWNDQRKAKAKQMKLSQSEVSVLASIVQAEQTYRRDERAKVAGLYVNRLKKGMRLESDPTIIYAIGDFTIQRVLDKDRNIKSLYNTYLYKGLPPGPINLPEINSIDAVLNYEKHDYIFMCAKEDFSGYHNFAKTYRQHKIYANRYRQELNRRRIYR